MLDRSSGLQKKMSGPDGPVAGLMATRTKRFEAPVYSFDPERHSNFP
jgi:hypothetical protein